MTIISLRTMWIITVLTLWPALALAQVGPPGEVINQGRKALVITPSDTVDLALGPTRFVYVSQAAACTIAMILADDTAAVTFAVPLNSTVPWMPVRAKRVTAANTTCTPIIGVW